MFYLLMFYYILFCVWEKQQQRIFGSYKEICDCIYEHLFMENRGDGGKTNQFIRTEVILTQCCFGWLVNTRESK